MPASNHPSRRGRQPEPRQVPGPRRSPENPLPSEMFAASEQVRADGLAHRLGAISEPAHPSHGSLHHYQAAYRSAAGAAAAHTAQPELPGGGSR